MHNKNLVGRSGDDFVAPLCGLDCRPAGTLFERRNKQQSASIHFAAPGNRQSNLFQCPCQADDDRLLSAQQNPQTLFLDRRMQSADDGHALIAKLPGAIVGAEDRIAWAAYGAKQGNLALGENSRIANSPKLGGCRGALI